MENRSPDFNVIHINLLIRDLCVRGITEIAHKTQSSSQSIIKVIDYACARRLVMLNKRGALLNKQPCGLIKFRRWMYLLRFAEIIR